MKETNKDNNLKKKIINFPKTIITNTDELQICDIGKIQILHVLTIWNYLYVPLNNFGKILSFRVKIPYKNNLWPSIS